MGARGPKTLPFSDDEWVAWRQFVLGVLRAARYSQRKFSSESAPSVGRNDDRWAEKALRPKAKPTIKIARAVVSALHRFPRTSQAFADSEIAKKPARLMPRWFPNLLRDLMEDHGLSNSGIHEFTASAILELTDWLMSYADPVLSTTAAQGTRKLLITQFVRLAQRESRGTNSFLTLAHTIPLVEDPTLTWDSSALEVVRSDWRAKRRNATKAQATPPATRLNDPDEGLRGRRQKLNR